MNLLEMLYRRLRGMPLGKPNIQGPEGYRVLTDTPQGAWPEQNPLAYTNRMDWARDTIGQERAFPPMAYRNPDPSINIPGLPSANDEMMLMEKFARQLPPQLMQQLMRRDLDMTLHNNRALNAGARNSLGSWDYNRIGVNPEENWNRIPVMHYGRPL